MIDVEKLKDGLEQLSGRDFSQAEKASRAAGNNSVVMNVTSDFQIRLAARALNCNPNDLFDLPIKEFNKILLEVTNFLFATLEENAESQAN